MLRCRVQSATMQWSCRVGCLTVHKSCSALTFAPTIAQPCLHQSRLEKKPKQTDLHFATKLGSPSLVAKLGVGQWWHEELVARGVGGTGSWWYGELERERARRVIPNAWRVGKPFDAKRVMCGTGSSANAIVAFVDLSSARSTACTWVIHVWKHLPGAK